MRRRDPDTSPQKSDLSGYVTVRELDARVATIMSELRWQRWGLIALTSLTLAQKAGMPNLPQLAAVVFAHVT